MNKNASKLAGIDVQTFGMLMHMFSFCKLLAMYVLDAFMLLETPKLKNLGLLILCNSIMLK